MKKKNKTCNQQKLFRRSLNTSSGRHLLPQKLGHQSHLLLSRFNRRNLRRHRRTPKEGIQENQTENQNESSRSCTELRALLAGNDENKEKVDNVADQSCRSKTKSRNEEKTNENNLKATSSEDNKIKKSIGGNQIVPSSKTVAIGNASGTTRKRHPVRRSQRLASLERTKSDSPSEVNSNSDKMDGIDDKEDTTLTTSQPSLPEIENTINLDHAYSKQLDSSKKNVMSSPGKYEEFHRGHYSFSRSNKLSPDKSKMYKKTPQKRHSDKNDDDVDGRQSRKMDGKEHLNEHSKMRCLSPMSDYRSPSPASSSSGSSPWSTPNEDKKMIMHQRAVNFKARRALAASRKEENLKKKVKVTNLKSNRRWYETDQFSLSEKSSLESATNSDQQRVGNKMWQNKKVNVRDDEDVREPKQRKKSIIWPMSGFVKDENGERGQEKSGSVNNEVWNVESYLEMGKMGVSGARRRGRPPKLNVDSGSSSSWQDSDETISSNYNWSSPGQWRRRVNKPSSKWAMLSHEQQNAAVKGWTYLMQLAFSPNQVKEFWEDVEKEFFKVQVKYIRYQNQNERPVDEEYLLVLRNTVVWKHIRWHHDAITKQLRRKMRELSWRQTEQRSGTSQCDRYLWMNKQMELIRCIDSILAGGENSGCSRHRVTSSSLTEILQTIDEVEQMHREVPYHHLRDRKMLEEILTKLQRPWSPVAVMPLGGESVSVPLPSNHELCDALLREAHLTCLPLEVVEAYLQMPTSSSESEDVSISKAVQYLV